MYGQCEPYFQMVEGPALCAGGRSPEQEATFLPIKIEADVVVEPALIDVPMPTPSAPLSASRVDITLSDGRRILVEGATALAAVVSLVQGLAV